MNPDKECSICGRLTPSHFQEKHHLVPKSKKGRETIDVCCNCGDQIHKLFTIKELEKQFNTLNSLLAHSDIQKWIQWVRNQKTFTFSMKTKKSKK